MSGTALQRLGALGAAALCSALAASAAWAEVWYTYTPIDDVFITSPAPNTAIGVNGEIAFTCSECRDRDLKVTGGVEEIVDDTVRYIWTCYTEGGGLVDGTFPYGNEGRIVTWKAPATPGNYTVMVAADDVDSRAPPCGGGSDNDEAKTAQLVMEVVSLQLTYPTDSMKLVGTASGVRTTLAYSVDVRCRFDPPGSAANASVTVYYRKGGAENSGTADYLGNGDYQYRFNITQRFTKADEADTSNRYRLRATASYKGTTIRTNEEPLFCIKKGGQIWRTASDWLHYPYHWGGKGPNQCSLDTSHGLPADGTFNHEPYSQEHPEGNGPHPCCFDCSGFTRHMYYDRHAILIPHGAAAQQDYLPQVAAPRVGDLLFYGDPAHHVAVNGETQKRHAPSTGHWTRTDDKGAPTTFGGPSGWGWCMTANCSHQ